MSEWLRPKNLPFTGSVKRAVTAGGCGSKHPGWTAPPLTKKSTSPIEKKIRITSVVNSVRFNSGPIAAKNKKCLVAR